MAQPGWSGARERCRICQPYLAQRDAIRLSKKVSLGKPDEEAARLVPSGNAYTASARVLTVLDEVLATVIGPLSDGGR